VAVLISMMIAPGQHSTIGIAGIWLSERRPFFASGYTIDWLEFLLQTVFLSVAAAVIVNLPKKKS
jgi:hypothetical protein